MDLAGRLIRAIEAGDIDAISALYHDDAVIWRNFDGLSLTKRQMLRIMSFLATGVKGLHYEDIRVCATEDGFVQEHKLCCELPDGGTMAAPSCLVAVVREGRIARIHEYTDSAAVSRLVAADTRRAR